MQNQANELKVGELCKISVETRPSSTIYPMSYRVIRIEITPVAIAVVLLNVTAFVATAYHLAVYL